MIIFSPWSDSGSIRWCLFINILDDYSVENSEDLILILVSNNPLVEVDENHSLVTINFVEDTDDCKLITLLDSATLFCKQHCALFY